MKILSHYFDLHEKSIVHLIQGIVLNQTGRRMTRQDIRRKYHFHECLFPQEATFFHQYYDFIYGRGFGLNRRVLILGKSALLSIERETCLFLSVRIRNETPVTSFPHKRC